MNEAQAAASKAISTVASLGNYFLSATIAMSKELLPIADKPLIQYASKDAISISMHWRKHVFQRSMVSDVLLSADAGKISKT